jgi:protein-S-isoprenylcysteine O-methyltransferase Ste14
LWLLFVAYRAVAAAGAKRSASRRRWQREIGLRLIVILLIVALLQSRSIRQFFAEIQRSASHSDWGPYARIRHPIYTGLILATLGSAIGVNVFWALMLVPVSLYFIYSARREETVMLRLFPEQYAAYMARTGMLAPCPFRRC